MNDSFVPLSELAKDLNMHRTHVKAFAIKHGVHITRIRTMASGHQETLAVSATDADALRQARQQWISGEPVNSDRNGKGWFYIVQPLPDLEPSRIKLGFSANNEQRLASYRTICPDATIVKTWPCRFTWEQCAIASATRIECKQIGQELFHCENLTNLVQRCDDFFALLPTDSI
jgi:hypothetical protein